MVPRALVSVFAVVLACGGDDAESSDGPGGTPDATIAQGEVSTADAEDGDATTAGDDDATTATSASTSPSTSSSAGDEGSADTQGEGTTVGGADGDSAGACPVPLGNLDCAGTCDLFVWECESCPMRPGDLCTYYPYQLDACLAGCAGLTDPDDFVYEVFACRQSVGMVCDEDAVAECLIEIDCA